MISKPKAKGGLHIFAIEEHFKRTPGQSTLKHHPDNGFLRSDLARREGPVIGAGDLGINVAVDPVVPNHAGAT